MGEKVILRAIQDEDEFNHTNNKNTMSITQ